MSDYRHFRCDKLIRYDFPPGGVTARVFARFG